MLILAGYVVMIKVVHTTPMFVMADNDNLYYK